MERALWRRRLEEEDITELLHVKRKQRGCVLLVYIYIYIYINLSLIYMLYREIEREESQSPLELSKKCFARSCLNSFLSFSKKIF